MNVFKQLFLVSVPNIDVFNCSHLPIHSELFYYNMKNNFKLKELLYGSI